MDSFLKALQAISFRQLLSLKASVRGWGFRRPERGFTRGAFRLFEASERSASLSLDSQSSIEPSSGESLRGAPKVKRS